MQSPTVRGVRVVATVVALALIGPTTATAAPAATRVVEVAHGPVTLPLVDAAPAGPSVGDLRTVWTPLTRPGRNRVVGSLTGSLLTVAVDRPTVGRELRTANLVFVIGRPADQIVVGGVASYPSSAPTFGRRTATVRPVIGGSGAFAGARGSATTVHLANGRWTHTFVITLASIPARAAATPTATGKVLVRRYLRLLVAKDVAGLDAFLSPAFQVQRADGSASTKAAYLRRLPDIKSFRLSGIVGTRAGDTLVVRYILRVTGTVEGRPHTPGPTPRLSTFALVDGSWRLVAHANFNPLTG